MVNIAPRLVACWLVAMIPIELIFINGGFMFPGDARIAGWFFWRENHLLPMTDPAGAGILMLT